ncbi:MAG: hypothetical protein HON76_02925 [Candidatus Scalindua sp.]|jgi:Kef-type K+ transport system membrane component KefB|nr:hypothetical protein [Candidatus Scalindua sp.]MBT5305641.1 hypothetical protein [Candidatus Scalindua sp.]MBT6046477.1 hypothetical protein [Candidatus Scalindua sp.]MBT6231717.1 hypothetical protein [Candidatus Scalindua sp.]MBT6561465.1 hypothetical protein [Candidatus Scalindua sp.]
MLNKMQWRSLDLFVVNLIDLATIAGAFAVGLIFAGIGKILGIINDVVFSALIIMVIITTLITPPALRMAMSDRLPKKQD